MFRGAQAAADFEAALNDVTEVLRGPGMTERETADMLADCPDADTAAAALTLAHWSREPSPPRDWFTD